MHCLHFRDSCLESPPYPPPLRPSPLHTVGVFCFLHQCWWGGWLGEIRGYGGEIRGEISQHLAAHTHTRPSWETLRSKHGGHERDAGTCQREKILSPFFNLAFSLSPSFPLSPSLRLPFFQFSEEVFREGERTSAVVSFLPDKGSGKTSNRRQTPAATRAVWREQSRKTHYKSNKFFKGSPSQRLCLSSWGHGFALTVSHTHMGPSWVRGHSIYKALSVYTAIKTDPQPGKEKQTGGKHAEISPRIQRPKLHISVKPIFCSNTEGKTQNTVFFCSIVNASLKLLKCAFLCGIPGKANTMTFNRFACNLDFPFFLLSWPSSGGFRPSLICWNVWWMTSPFICVKWSSPSFVCLYLIAALQASITQHPTVYVSKGPSTKLRTWCFFLLLLPVLLLLQPEPAVFFSFCEKLKCCLLLWSIWAYCCGEIGMSGLSGCSVWHSPAA